MGQEGGMAAKTDGHPRRPQRATSRGGLDLEAAIDLLVALNVAKSTRRP